MGISLIVESFHFENISRSELNIHTNAKQRNKIQNRGTKYKTEEQVRTASRMNIEAESPGICE